MEITTVSGGDCYKLGDLVVKKSREILRARGQTAQKRESIGNGQVYEVYGLLGTKLEIVDFNWDNGDRDVQCLPTSILGDKLNCIASRLRMSIKKHPLRRGYLIMDITLAKPTSIGLQGLWAQRFKAEREEITEACGFDITNSLKKVGASLGRREFIVNDIGRRRHFLVMEFHKDNAFAPIAAFVLTRVLPLYRSDARDI